MTQYRMGIPMSDRPFWLYPRFAPSCLALALVAGLVLTPAAARAQPAAAAPTAAAAVPAAIANSALDQRLFYQVLIAEMALGSGDAASAYELILDAARRSRDEGLFGRAVDIALRARAGEQALAASRAWRVSHPESLAALRLQLQILMVLNRTEALGEPLEALLAQTPVAARPGLIAALPRFLQRAGEPRLVGALLEETLAPYRDAAGTRVPVRVALGRAWQQAHDPDRALALAREAQALEPQSPGGALLAMELMRERPAAEDLVVEYLQRARAEPGVRLAYVRLLTTSQRYADAVAQLMTLTQQQPDLAPAHLSLGALQLELKQLPEGEASLRRYVELAQAQAGKPASAQAAHSLSVGAEGEDDADDDTTPARPEQGLVQAWLMLAQAAEQRGDFTAARAWLDKVDDPQHALDVQGRRASMLARQGKVDQARELLRQVPERKPDDARAKLLAEAGLLREVKLWREAFALLGGANQRFPDDADLLYEQAMVAEKIDRLDEMERLLRRVIELKPENAHAHNALGYSLADRSQRLPEARQLIQRALELAPGDPFITDSLGWVEFRLGNRSEAAALLQRAYASRPDTEIAAHLGEVLWALGQRDEARRVWREGRVRDTANEVLRETLARLRVDL
jgi:tetratricopeptide (TPR) repeat protein